MTNPVIEWTALTPILIVLIAAVVSVLVEAFVPRGGRRATQLVLSVIALASAFVALVWRWSVVRAHGPSTSVVGLDSSAGQDVKTTLNVGTLVEDLPALAFQGVIVMCALFSVMVMADRTGLRLSSFVSSAATDPGSMEEKEADNAGLEQTEIFPLALFSTAGMMAFVGASDVLTLFVALEVFSLPLYVLCALARRRRALSQEAALKYFILGAFSSAFFLMGAALLYGFSGSLNYLAISGATRTATGMDTLMIAGVSLVLVGLLFKVGAAPFHSWTPDTYQGAPTPVTGFMAAGTKAAAFAAMLRFVYEIGGGASTELSPFFWFVIIVTMLAGTVGGIVQSDVKRMLAYSSIAHAGFVLIAVNAYSGEAIRSVVFYMLSYGLASVGAFAVVSLVREKDEDGRIYGEATTMNRWKGLGKRSPLLAGAMAVFLLSFAGIPLTGGFIGKFLVFSAGYASGQAILVFIAVLASAATAFFYFRLIKLMFFDEPEEGTAVVSSEGFSSVVIAVTAVLTVLFGLLPNLGMGFIESITAFMMV